MIFKATLLTHMVQLQALGDSSVHTSLVQTSHSPFLSSSFVSLHLSFLFFFFFFFILFLAVFISRVFKRGFIVCIIEDRIINKILVSKEEYSFLHMVTSQLLHLDALGFFFIDSTEI